MFIWIFIGYIVFEYALWIHRALNMMSSLHQCGVVGLYTWSEDQVPPVSFIIPCRNEEKNLPRLLPTLAAQTYPNLQIVLVDDRSEDRTLQLLKTFESQHAHVKVIQGKEKPQEWSGKTHALHQGVAEAKGDWFLFSDADTQHHPDSVSSSLHYAQARNIEFLTLTSQYLCESFAEHLIQPMAIGCGAVWLKFRAANDPKSKVPLAVGHYMLINRACYEGSGGFESVKHEVVEDLALCKRVREDGRFRVELAIGCHVYKTRMYDSFTSAWIGWRRIFLHALGQKASVLISKMAALFLNGFVPFLALVGTGIMAVQGRALAIPLFWANFGLVAFILLMRTRSHKAIRAPYWSVLLHPLSALVLIAILSDCLRHDVTGKKVPWKGEMY